MDDEDSGIWIVAFCAGVACCAGADVDEDMVVVSSDGSEDGGGTGNGIEKLCEMCVEIDDRICTTLVETIVAVGTCGVVALCEPPPPTVVATLADDDPGEATSRACEGTVPPGKTENT